MPIYEYKCPECEHAFEKLVSMSAPLPACPECGSEVKKLVSAGGFILKGSGWYSDHYGLKKGAGDSSASKSSDSSSKKSGTDSSGSSKAPKASSSSTKKEA